MQFVFDHHTLDTERRELLRGGATVAMQPQVFDVLLYLLQNREAADIGSWTPTASIIWKRSAGRDWNSFGSTARRAAARRACPRSLSRGTRAVAIGQYQSGSCNCARVFAASSRLCSISPRQIPMSLSSRSLSWRKATRSA